MSEPQAAEHSAATIEQILRELDESGNRLPEEAIRAARLHREEIIPRLIQAIRDAVACARANELVAGNLHFFAPFLLAELHATEALPAIVEVLQLPVDWLDDLYGDAITEAFAPILAELAADRPDVIEDLIRNREQVMFVRLVAAEVFLFFVRDRRLTRAEAIERLRTLLREAIVQRDADGAEALVISLDCYAPREAIGEIREALRLGLVDKLMIDLATIERHIDGDDREFQKCIEHCRPTGIPDTIALLSTWHYYREKGDSPIERFDDDLLDDDISEFDDDFGNGLGWDPPPPHSDTIRNTRPRIGRNDSCPCGSGKKFKKCCGGR